MVAVDETALSPTLSSTYISVAEMVASNDSLWGAWKLGGTNQGSCKAFGVTELYYGALTSKEVFVEPRKAPGFSLVECKGEVEIAIRLGADGRGDAWAVALEMPASGISNLMDLGVRALVADRCAAGALLLGPIQAMPLPDFSQSRFVLEADGKILDTAGIEGLTGPPEQLLNAFLAMADRHGVDVKPGQWVATGGITRCMELTPETRVRVLLDGTAHLDFTSDMGAGT